MFFFPCCGVLLVLPSIPARRSSDLGIFLQMEADGGDLPHNNMQPFLVVNYIIKV